MTSFSTLRKIVTFDPVQFGNTRFVWWKLVKNRNSLVNYKSFAFLEQFLPLVDGFLQYNSNCAISLCSRPLASTVEIKARAKWVYQPSKTEMSNIIYLYYMSCTIRFHISCIQWVCLCTKIMQIHPFNE